MNPAEVHWKRYRFPNAITRGTPSLEMLELISASVKQLVKPDELKAQKAFDAEFQRLTDAQLLNTTDVELAEDQRQRTIAASGALENDFSEASQGLTRDTASA